MRRLDETNAGCFSSIQLDPTRLDSLMPQESLAHPDRLLFCLDGRPPLLGVCHKKIHQFFPCGNGKRFSRMFRYYSVLDTVSYVSEDS